MTNIYTLQDVALKNGTNGNRLWVVIRDIVYDLTDYVDDHPGGGELVFEYAGQDGTKAFDDFGHSADAMGILKAYKKGELAEEDKKVNRKNCKYLPDGSAYCEKALKKKRSPCLFFCR